jgi:hypothetical protein
MFNSKLHHFLSDNEDYLNQSYAAPYLKQELVHNCTTPFHSYKNSGGLLQTWGDKNAAVEMFGMRPITNPKDYFNNIKDYLGNLVINDRNNLIDSGLINESYSLFLDTGDEPLSSFISMINLEVTDFLNYVMANSTDGIPMFNEYNPLCESFVITDIKMTTYKSTTNDNHFYNVVLFSAVNTTRYNTISFKAEIYQDTSKIISSWTDMINKTIQNKDLQSVNNLHSDIYIYNIGLLNNENKFNTFDGYSLGNGYAPNNGNSLTDKNYYHQPASKPSRVISTGGTNTVGNLNTSGPVKEMNSNLLSYQNGLSNTIYDNQGNPYGMGLPNVGTIGLISDNGPDNIDKLIKELGYN